VLKNARTIQIDHENTSSYGKILAKVRLNREYSKFSMFYTHIKIGRQRDTTLSKNLTGQINIHKPVKYIIKNASSLMDWSRAYKEKKF